MRLAAAVAAAALLAAACTKQPISSEYGAEMSALAAPGKGLPYLAGKDLRPVWDPAASPEPRAMSQFNLRDQEGREVNLESLKGKIAIVSFFFSRCPGICPMTVKNLRKVQDSFKHNDKVVMLSLSVTPEHDTPKVLRSYARINKIDAKKWHLLTGDKKQIYALARDSFSADTFSAKENNLKKLNPEDFLHSENVYLLDHQQKLRGIYVGLMETSLKELTRDAEALLQ